MEVLQWGLGIAAGIAFTFAAVLFVITEMKVRRMMRNYTPPEQTDAILKTFEESMDKARTESKNPKEYKDAFDAAFDVAFPMPDYLDGKEIGNGGNT